MPEPTHEQRERAAEAGREQPEASENGVHPSGNLGTGVALTIGGAVVGAALALLRGRRASHTDGTDAHNGPQLADELAARASAAARGSDEADDHGDDEDEPESAHDESEPEAVGAAHQIEPEAAAGGGDHDSGERDDAEPRADAASATQEREAAGQEEEDGEAAEGSSDARRPERDAAEGRHESDGAGEAAHSASGARDDVGGSGESAPDGSGRKAEPADNDESRRGGGSGAVTAARAAARQLAELTGRPPEAVLGVERRDGGWRVTLEVVEVSRTPPTTDVLGRYEVELDGDEELVEYHQAGRYVRGSALEER